MATGHRDLDPGQKSAVPDATVATLSASLPTSGSSDFSVIRARGQVYVDKTAYIERMLAEPLDYAFLARPRRFGKSLLVSTLQHMYARANDDLFHGLAIQQSGFLARVPSCPVLALDMSSVAANNVENLNADLRAVLRNQCLVLGIAPPPPEDTPWNGLNHVIQTLSLQSQRKVVVLVDEYDAPITDMLEAGLVASHADQTQIMFILRYFYRVLKSQTSCIEFVFVTGVSRVEGAGLFSSFNNLVDISLDPHYGALCGFTEAETQAYFGAHIACAAETCASGSEDLCADLRDYYNGYQFAERSAAVYNPVAYLGVLKQLMHPTMAHRIRARGFPRSWVNTGMPHFLFQYMKAHRYDQRDIEKDPQRIEDKFGLSNPDLTSLMFQAGFLTYATDSMGETMLEFPNREVKEAFDEGLLLTYLNQTARSTKMNRLWSEMENALGARDFKQVCACFNRLLDGVTFDMLRHEGDYQKFLFLVFSLMPSVVRVEAEVHTRHGKTDVVVETSETFVVIELKRNRSAQAALKQIAVRDYGAKYAGHGKAVYGIGLNFNEPKGRQGHDAWDRTAQNWEMAQIEIYDPAA